MGRYSDARGGVMPVRFRVLDVIGRLASYIVLSLLFGPAHPGESASSAQLPPEWLAPEGGWKEGVHYDVLGPDPSPRKAGRIEVLEFFSYGCPHCYTLEPWLVLWNRNRPVDVEFRRAHVSWRKIQLAHARLYYTLMALGREDLHDVVFSTVHRAGDPLFAEEDARTLDRQAAFAAEHGVDAQKFRRTHESDVILRQVAEAQELAKQYKVVGTPTVVIDGRYVTDTFRAGGNHRLTLLIDHLIAIERRAAPR